VTDGQLQVAMILLNNSGIGGAERRFAQVYMGLRQRKVPISLVINQSLLRRLVHAGVLEMPEPSHLVLKEPFGILGRFLLSCLNSEKGNETPETNRDDKLSVLRESFAFGLRKLDYVLACFMVGWWLLRRRPKVMHLVMGGAYVALPLQLLRSAPPAVTSIVSPNLDEMVGSRIGLRLYRLSLRFAQIIDALTESIGDILKKESVQLERIRISTGSSINGTRFHPQPVKRPWVVFAGRFVPEKNPALFIETCALVQGRCPRAVFYALGAGPLQTQIVELVRRYGLQTCTHVGWHEQIETILTRSLVFVSLQRTDNYPSQALLEAMACGAAVVATDVGLTWKLVDEAVGFRVEATPASLAEAIIYLLEHHNEAVAMGQCGRRRVIEQHSMDAYLDYLEQIYHELSGDEAVKR
jgi:glycosyltransferase involved in cell wall biosynthesis